MRMLSSMKMFRESAGEAVRMRPVRFKMSANAAGLLRPSITGVCIAVSARGRLTPMPLC